jgi:hypothetical protein
LTYSPLTDRVYLTSDSSSRNGGKVDRFIVHHAATTSLAAILALFQPGGRTVSASYALGSDGTLVLAVDEDRRPWTSASEGWDGRAVTIEVANSSAGGAWPVSDAAFDKLARLIADVSIRYGFPINDDTVLTHQELYTRYGDSYPTACPGDLQRRKAELLRLANKYRTSATAGGDEAPIEKEYDMTSPVMIRRRGNPAEWMLLDPILYGIEYDEENNPVTFVWPNGDTEVRRGFRVTDNWDEASVWKGLYSPRDDIPEAEPAHYMNMQRFAIGAADEYEHRVLALNGRWNGDDVTPES